MLSYALVLVVGAAAGIVSGIVGTGATVILLPVLVFAFGPLEAVPIMAIVALMSNLAMIPSRRWLAARDYRIGIGALVPAGFAIGFLAGIVVSTGPLSVSLFSAYGLTKGAFIATEAAGSLAVHLSKAATFRTLGALPADIIVKGLITGAAVMAGTYTARLLVERLRLATFQNLLDGVMLISGLTLIWLAVR